MAISKPRNRVVLFRLTQEEYQQVQEACQEGGARSVSDFARARILGAGPVGSLTQIQAQLAELTATVARLTEAVTGSQPRAEAAGAGYGANLYAKPGV
jgi:hypothetical protein